MFISYSWDSEDHKKWVFEFAKQLRTNGIDAVLDRMHLGLGARSPEFMERSIRENNRVLVICTEKYKDRFDKRKGGAGYEGHIITGEIVSEVGKDKFIPVLRQGDWEDSLPTALLGVTGVDLRTDSPSELRKLIEDLHGISSIPPVGPRPAWLERGRLFESRGAAVSPSSSPEPDPREFLEQLKRLPETDLLRKIWSKPYWRIWIRPTEFKPARFQSVDQCRQFILADEVVVHGWFAYPSFSVETLQTAKESVSGENELAGRQLSRAERWTLFQSGQFVQNRGVDEIPQLGDRIHVLEILDVVTAAVEFASRMAGRRVFSPRARISFELRGIAGRSLTWPRDLLGDTDAVGRNCWSQEDVIKVERYASSDELETQKRGLALQLAVEIYTKFGWTELPVQLLEIEQKKRFGD
ncbi:MAG: toll/interleukin-1 receptor domain-containing protein [Acidobacteriia bacterium]|nr:toll/interleukin-1 receptor domain-containing protein [Terriglobia bacterium]